MSLYYLMAQLPSLDNTVDGAPLPITEERFLELCESLAGTKTRKLIEGLSLLPERNGQLTGSTLVDAWNARERALRLALGKVRAEKRSRVFDAEYELPSELLQSARTAAEMTDPLEAERFLYDNRLKYLESLRPTDTFAEDSLLYYGLKLKLILRFRLFDREKGMAEYKRIYDSVLDGVGKEALQ